MIRRTARAVAGAALAGAAVAALASPAAAAHEERWDPRDDGKWDEFGEIWGTEVDYGKQLKVRAWFDHYTDGHYFMVDTVGDTTPDFLIDWWTEDFGAEGATYVSVHRLRDGEPTRLRCTPDTVKYDEDLPHQMSFTVPVSCLRLEGESPEKLRVRGKTHTVAADSNPVDKVRYTDWVTRG
ncbi:hypothetical protein HNR19_001524 [Nocardioides thalensis]|uniref:Uncharacterized protein n=1 Tax=Nocardioides thalensis TaxID=1914755 RepID=A0A853C1F0_9ACTN|nr:hypothetical protein [Nocardioides thalensis]NYJ00826.1 hypothetical protein [Nocardioides thalensis]